MGQILSRYCAVSEDDRLAQASDLLDENTRVVGNDAVM